MICSECSHYIFQTSDACRDTPMNTLQIRNADHVLAAIQERWGQKAAFRASDLQPSARIPTGFPELDALLMGGVPVGRITELIGRPTSGKTTVTLSLMATAQKQGVIAVYLDTAAHADPDYLVRMGISVADLLIVRTSLVASLALLRDIIASSIPCIVLLELPHRLTNADTQQIDATLRPLIPVLARTNSVVLILAPIAVPLGQSRTAVRLIFNRDAWVAHEKDVVGCQVVVHMARQAHGGESTATLTLSFPDSFAEDKA